MEEFIRRSPEWLKSAVFYEVYPQSFCDANGDGIGDFAGIVGKLDYIKSLGATAIWMNPCFDSPFRDAGYDVRDYYKTAGRYGTNDELRELIAAAHRRGLRLLLDLVPGHSSIECEYFKAAAAKTPSPFDDYYIWKPGCHSHPGGYTFISGYAERNADYMTNFFFCQAALNYGFSDLDPRCPWQKSVDDPAVVNGMRAELRRIMKFYLDMGCDGFRVDMAASVIRGLDKKLVSVELRRFWREYREWMREEYPEAVLVAEWGDPGEAIAAGFDVDFFISWNNDDQSACSTMFRRAILNRACDDFLPELSNCFFCRNSSGDSRTFVDKFSDTLEKLAGQGFCGLVTGNHDLYRISWGRSEADLKVLYTALMTLPGIPFIYYGDEIGMRYLPQVGNVEGSYERGGSRTPMQWDATPSAGFSTADPGKYYTMLDPDPHRPNVADEDADADSLLNATRQLVKLRRSCPALGVEGELRVLVSEFKNAPLVYERTLGDQRFLVALNPDAAPRRLYIGVAGTPVKILQFGAATEIQLRTGHACLEMGGVSAAIFELTGFSE